MESMIRIIEPLSENAENIDDAAYKSAERQTKITWCPTVTNGAETPAPCRECARKASHERPEWRLRQIARGRTEPRDRSQAQQVRDPADGTELYSRFVRSSAEAR